MLSVNTTQKIIKIAGRLVVISILAYMMTLISILAASPTSLFAPLNDCYPLAQECSVGHKMGGFPFTFLLGETAFGFWPNMLSYVIITSLIFLIISRLRKAV